LGIEIWYCIAVVNLINVLNHGIVFSVSHTKKRGNAMWNHVHNNLLTQLTASIHRMRITPFVVLLTCYATKEGPQTNASLAKRFGAAEDSINSARLILGELGLIVQKPRERAFAGTVVLTEKGIRFMQDLQLVISESPFMIEEPELEELDIFNGF
jgi:hypothetical protein